MYVFSKIHAHELCIYICMTATDIGIIIDAYHLTIHTPSGIIYNGTTTMTCAIIFLCVYAVSQHLLAPCLMMEPCIARWLSFPSTLSSMPFPSIFDLSTLPPDLTLYNISIATHKQIVTLHATLNLKLGSDNISSVRV